MKELLTTNKKAKYFGDSRYEKVWEQMKLLGIQDVSTTRQSKNGTIVWKLPIKNEWNNGSFIEVASFKTGYVRNQNSGYSNYQLNKRCESEPQYYKSVNKNGDFDKDWCDRPLYTQYTTRSCKLIPIEIDRLEYLISYCLKNYYIKHANFVADGEFVPKWRHEYELEQAKDKHKKLDDFHEAYADFNNSMLEGMVPKWKYDEAMNLGHEQDCGHYDRIKDLENKLATIQRISDHG